MKVYHTKEEYTIAYRDYRVQAIIKALNLEAICATGLTDHVLFDEEHLNRAYKFICSAEFFNNKNRRVFIDRQENGLRYTYVLEDCGWEIAIFYDETREKYFLFGCQTLNYGIAADIYGGKYNIPFAVREKMDAIHEEYMSSLSEMNPS